MHLQSKSLLPHWLQWFGKQVRDVLNINDLANLLDLQMKVADRWNGSTYNVMV